MGFLDKLAVPANVVCQSFIIIMYNYKWPEYYNVIVKDEIQFVIIDVHIIEFGCLLIIF